MFYDTMPHFAKSEPPIRIAYLSVNLPLTVVRNLAYIQENEIAFPVQSTLPCEQVFFKKSVKTWPDPGMLDSGPQPYHQNSCAYLSACQ